MSTKPTLYFPASFKPAWILPLLLVLFSLGSQAQISLAKWEMQGPGPTVTPTTSLSMNTNRLVSAVGQPTAAFVTSNSCNVFDLEFMCNGWNNGIGTSYYLINFGTLNYSSNTIEYELTVSSTLGPRNFQTQYSVNGATGPWTNIGSPLAFLGSVPACGIIQTPVISLPAACNNQDSVWVRIYTTENITIIGNTAGPILDNVEIKGVAMTAPGITGQPSSQTICEGADVNFAITASNAISYQWEYRTSGAGAFINVPNNSTYDNETTPTLTVNNVTAAMSGYQFRCNVTGGTLPNAISNNATLTVNAYGTWSGSTNSDWNNPANWQCNQVPTAATNVTINSGGNQPQVNINNALCNNLTINNGATLSFSGTTNVLSINGAVTATGTLNGSAGKVVFTGAAAQTVPPGTYKDLQVNGAGNKTLGGNVTVTGILTLSNGLILLGGNNLTLGNAGSTTGASSASYIVTNGSGQLINQNIGSGGKTGNITFPVGASATAYTPLIINNTGTADAFSAMVIEGSFSSYTGTTGSGPVSSNAVNKTWFLSEGTPGGSSVNLQLSWNTNNELAGFDRDNCKLSHYTGGAWNSGPLTTALGGNPYFISRSGITSFSPFGVGSQGSPLPLDLLSFTGSQTHEGILLKWVTENEKTIRYFDVERSANTDQFSAAGKVMARGNSQRNEYTYLDNTAGNHPVLFYRLKVNEEGGMIHYSTILRLVPEQGNEQVVVYPNPVKEDFINISCSGITAESISLSVVDIKGAAIFTQQAGTALRANGIISVPVKTLVPGYYVLKVQRADGSIISNIKFVRQ